MTNRKLDKIFLKVVLIFEIALTALIATGFIPRELAWLITAAMLLYIAGANTEDSFALTILSIPFFLALPITSSFDSMANWRIILSALFLKFVLEKCNIQHLISNAGLKNIGYCPPTADPPKAEILDIKNTKQFLLSKDNRLIFWSFVFALVAILSLVGSANASAGLKKILFLANIFILFVVAKNLVRNKETFLRILKVSVLAGIFSLMIGYLQVLSILRFSLAHFWQFWNDNAITAMYGTNLSDLLSYSNTWFSYYPGDIPPTLRMFSIFPDSHSFALFNIVLIPFILTLILYYKSKDKARLLKISCVLLAATLLGIILSGSRGTWVSGIMPLGVSMILIAANFKRKTAVGKGDLSQKFKLKIKSWIHYLINNKFGIIASTTILFFILFPVSSVVLEQTQKAEWRRINSQGDFASFAVYKRLRSIADLDEISNKGRIEIWKDTLASVKKHPVLGVGIGNFPTVLGKNISAAKKGASAHNLYLDIMSEMGILGLVAFSAILYEILKTARNIFMNSKDDLYRFFALSAGIYLFWNLGYALFDVVLFNDKVLMMFMVELGLLYGIKTLK